MKENIFTINNRLQKGEITTEQAKNELLVLLDVNGSCEQKQVNNGDLVPLVWMIEKLRKREGGCTMNELAEEAKRNFKGIENIKHKTINYR
tara:strand:+ start:659 stop:931 length:273 start_codon:yes stop_codon:yes gene_type:complete